MSRQNLPSVQSRVPVELYRPIFQLVSASDLSRLCAVSHAFRDESESILYRSVDLHCYSIAKTHSWSVTVAERPHLAGLVQSLCLSNELPWTASGKSLDLLKSLPVAFKAIVNLTEFIIRPHDPLGTLQSYLTSEMFEGCTFRLQKFLNMGPNPIRGNIVKLFMQQPTISDWSLGLSGLSPDRFFHLFPPKFPTHMLPLLSIVHLHVFLDRDMPLVNLVATRPVQKLNFRIVDDLARSDACSLLQSLHPCRHTLTSLQLETHGYTAGSLSLEERWTTDVIIALVAEHLPGLKFLGYRQQQTGHSLLIPKCAWNEVNHALSKMKNLEALIVEFITVVEGISLDRHTRSEERCLERAAELMGDGPSLRRVAFSVHHNSQRACACYHKSPSGQVELEGYDIFDDSAWRTV